MLKIKWIGNRTAEYTENGTWRSKDMIFQNCLNITATPAQIKDYVPDKEAAVLELAKENFPGLEVMEFKKPEPLKVSPDTDY